VLDRCKGVDNEIDRTVGGVGDEILWYTSIFGVSSASSASTALAGMAFAGMAYTASDDAFWLTCDN
jgi:hypothetical protein